MKIPKLELEKIIKLFTQRFSSKIQKPDIIGYEWVDNSSMTGVKYMKKRTPPEAPEWFQAYEERQNAFNTEVREFMVKTDKRLDTIEKDMIEVKKDVQVLKGKVDAIMECPTIKKELTLKE